MTEPLPDARTVDAAEVAKFSAMAERWWDRDGPLRPLHAMNPCRLGYIKAQICAETGRDDRAPRALEGLRVLDVGCGGGLICEPMARLGAEIVGVDASPEAIAAARLHAEDAGLKIDYRAATAETLAAEGETFDAVLALEIVEHVADPQVFIDACARMVRPGGLLVLSTLNRTVRSYAMAILGAEYILGWLPKGSHDWSRFLTPDELDRMLTAANLDPIDRRGMRPDPLAGRWSLSGNDLAVNYLVTATRTSERA